MSNNGTAEHAAQLPTTAVGPSLIDLIRALLAERETVRARIAAIDHELDAVRQELGIAPPPLTLTEAVAAGQPTMNVVDQPPLRAHALDTGILSTSEGQRADAILKLLATGPLSTRLLAKRLNEERFPVKQTLTDLKRKGLIESHGNGSGRKWARRSQNAAHRASTPRAMPPPAQAVKTTRPHTPVSETTVKSRDEAILTALKGAGREGLSADELQSALPREPWLSDDQAREALTHTLTRLSAKFRATQLEDRRWRFVS